MSSGFASVAVEDGVPVRWADVNGFTVREFRFPAGYRQEAFEAMLPYLALVLDGDMVKSFRARTMEFGRGSAFTMPAGMWHRARFGSSGATIVILRPRSESIQLTDAFRRLVELRGRGFNWLAWRLAAELRASDAAAPLAAEGLTLEILAATAREATFERVLGRSPRWLNAAEELLRARIQEPLGLSELADAVGVNASHLARVFRARYGISVGEYGRRFRIDWAAAEITRDERPLAEIAAAAGFADQSHFTRLFRRRLGTTPARFREEARRVPG